MTDDDRPPPSDVYVHSLLQACKRLGCDCHPTVYLDLFDALGTTVIHKAGCALTPTHRPRGGEP